MHSKHCIWRECVQHEAAERLQKRNMHSLHTIFQRFSQKRLMVEVRQFLRIADFMVKTETFRNIIMSIIEREKSAGNAAARVRSSGLYREREGVGSALFAKNSRTPRFGELLCCRASVARATYTNTSSSPLSLQELYTFWIFKKKSQKVLRCGSH